MKQLTAGDLMKMILRRHEGAGWQVFVELANSTGGRVSRRADAVAMALWPSLGLEVHGYECKVSRGDVRKELIDVQKNEPVGKYCDFWWLVISDPSIIDGLMLPPTWGVLVPRDRVLRVHVQAKKRKAVPPDRGFVASMLRSASGTTISRLRHQQIVGDLHDQIAELEKKLRDQSCSTADQPNDELRETVRVFEEHAGFKITDRRWSVTNFVEAVRLLTRKGLAGVDPTIRRLQAEAQYHQREADSTQKHIEDLQRIVEEGGDFASSQDPDQGA